jgi:hypothetical protein
VYKAADPEAKTEIPGNLLPTARAVQIRLFERCSVMRCQVQHVIAAVMVTSLAISIGRAEANLITLAPVGATVVDFSQFGGAFVLTAGPVQVGDLVGEDVIYTANQNSSVIGNSTYGLDTNGFWNSGRNGYTGVNNQVEAAEPNAITFTFDAGPIMAVGGFMNYAPGIQGVVLIEALGSSGVVLESYVLNSDAPIITPDPANAAKNAGAFRGIARPTNDIQAFRYSGAAAVLDDLTFVRVPEPSTLLLVVLSVAGIGCFLPLTKGRDRFARRCRADIKTADENDAVHRGHRHV